MALPKISSPLFEDTLQSTGEKFKYRPFSVKEEKILLIAKASESMTQTILALKQVLNSCVFFEDENKKIDDLPIFDLEYIMLKLRARAVNNEIELLITDTETEEKVKVFLDIDEMKTVTFENHTNKIQLNDTHTLIMKYPTIDIMFGMDDPSITEAEKSFNIMIQCLDKLVSDETVYDLENESVEEIIEFLEDLDGKNISKIREFFETTPKVRHEIKYKNSLGNEKTFVIEGTQTFFI